MIETLKRFAVVTAFALAGCGHPTDLKGLNPSYYLQVHDITAERDSPFVEALRATPYHSPEPEHQRVYATFSLLDLNDEAIRLAESNLRQRTLHLLGEPALRFATIGEALDYEAANHKSLLELWQRWFQSRLRVRFAVEEGVVPDTVFTDKRYHYYAHSIWRPNGAPNDQPEIGLIAENIGSDSINVRGTVSLQARGGGQPLSFDCMVPTGESKIAPGASTFVICSNARRPDYKGFPYKVDEVDDAVRFAMERSTPLTLSTSDLTQEFFPGLYRNTRATQQAFDQIVRTDCIDRGTCLKTFLKMAQETGNALLSLFPIAVLVGIGVHRRWVAASASAEKAATPSRWKFVLSVCLRLLLGAFVAIGLIALVGLGSATFVAKQSSGLSPVGIMVPIALTLAIGGISVSAAGLSLYLLSRNKLERLIGICGMAYYFILIVLFAAGLARHGLQ